MSSIKYDIWLANATQKRPRAANELLEHFGTSEKIFFADRPALEKLPFLRRWEVDALCEKKLTASRKILEVCKEKGISIITIADAVYPFRLKNIYDAPVVLYIRGTLPDIDEEAVVAIIGTRKCTAYGIRSARRIAKEIAEGGGVVVTGLARGIDTAAAEGAIEGGGKVLGILGCGIDIVYPPENAKLFDAVAKNGALISEYPPGTPPDKFRFPARNRIMSGFALATAVIEAPVKSGALITANHAAEQGRDVFVLPGNVDSPACEGSNQLLMEGAAPFMRGSDILSNYFEQYPDKLMTKHERPEEASAAGEPPAELTDEVQRKVYDALWSAPMRPDELIEACGCDAAEVMVAITMLQLSGHIEPGDGDELRRVNK